MAIRCADALPNATTSAHSNAQDVLTSLARNSPLVGNEFYELGFCQAWPIKSKSYYGGEFKLEEGHLDTPVLITNQRHDPVTPLGAAELALENYGGNARLLQQNGDGHCVIGMSVILLICGSSASMKLTISILSRASLALHGQARTSYQSRPPASR